MDEVKNVRDHFIGCIVKNLEFTTETFKKFIQLQNKLHDNICEKRNVATIATHDFDKLVSILVLCNKFIYSLYFIFVFLSLIDQNLNPEVKKVVSCWILYYYYYCYIPFNRSLEID